MSMRVVLVDDSGEFIATARRLLERDGVHVLGTATTGAEAVEKVREVRPDVTLVDIDLGGESGFDVVRRVLDGFENRSPAILISSHSPEDFADLIADSPAAGFLSKSNLSAAAIRAVIQAGPSEPAAE
jgi:two-component system, NarL family, nitrate/nitrite response regulator NarL